MGDSQSVLLPKEKKELASVHISVLELCRLKSSGGDNRTYKKASRELEMLPARRKVE